MKYTLQIITLFIAFHCFTPTSNAQIKIGENNVSINADAMLEIESKNKGILLPRVSLVSTTSALPLKAFTTGMIVFNTANTNDVSPGLYYSDGIKWIKAINNTPIGAPYSPLHRSEMVSTDGQLIFKTPGTITDQTKILLYRNGILIAHTVNNNESIIAEIPCKQGDQIRIIQL